MGGTAVECQIELLREVAPLLPAGKRITFFGNAEFRAVALQTYCQSQVWPRHVGLKGDLHIQLESGQWLPLIDLPIRPRSGPVCCQNFRFTAKHAFGPVNILARWSRKEHWPRFWATDLSADRDAWRRGRKRFWIEPTFRDWKSGGFDLEGSRLIDHRALHGLVSGMAITTLWMVHVGLVLSTYSRRPFVDVLHKRDYSLFRLGRDYLRRADVMGWPVLIDVAVHQPAPHRWPGSANHLSWPQAGAVGLLLLYKKQRQNPRMPTSLITESWHRAASWPALNCIT